MIPHMRVKTCNLSDDLSVILEPQLANMLTAISSMLFKIS
jgi:hypothetical protein